MNNPNDRISFMKSIKQLLDMRSIFINCPKIRSSNDSEVTILSQRAVLGKEVLESKDNTMTFFEEVQLGA